VFSKVLIANRGEIAVRVARTCRELDVATVAVYSDVDADARHVAAATQAVHLPGVSPAETYLNVQAIGDAARSTGAEAVHPGYGFLSEQAEAAEAFQDAGLAWIGPPPDALRAAGDKVRARRLARSAGVEPVPGTTDPVTGPIEVRAFAEEHGFPIAIKAAGGGGGRGLKLVEAAEDIEAAFDSAVREASAYFGSDEVYVERYLARPKHVEVQILAPAPGHTAWLGARDCSLQRRHQKIVEETPPPSFSDLVPAMGDAAVRVADACGYVNAGTVEFLIDTDAPGGAFFFLEVNARLQVEHTITEEVLGIDLVAAQLRIASGDPLGFDPSALAPRGHAIECRINAEDPARGFLPAPGRITRYREPGGPGIRVDSGFGEGDEIPGAYDSLLAKLVAWGGTREEARRRMLRALDEFRIEGPSTTIRAHRLLLESPAFVDGTYTTTSIQEVDLASLGPTTDAQAGPGVLVVEGTPAALWHPAIAPFVASGGWGGSPDRGAVVAPMHGTILKILVAKGDAVETGDPVAVLEAMKMETFLAAPSGGVVASIDSESGDVVEAGQIVARITEAGKPDHGSPPGPDG
jgi:acetyl-CoA/propionyl-CoA/long-chain acyl-CoA carboxylase, biotin carboxylase, biotin carboxyl carrier protein